jgi:hypothetical protein
VVEARDDNGRNRHPSGRPLRASARKSLSVYRSPGIGPLVPRLREPEPKDAIGFHRQLVSDDDE